MTRSLLLAFLLTLFSICGWAACPAQLQVSGTTDFVLGMFGPGPQFGSVGFNVATGDSNCSWQVHSDSWITFSPSSGSLASGNTFLSYSVLQNTTASPRTNNVSITMNGVVVYSLSITQNSTSCTYTPSLPLINIPASGGLGSYEIDTSPAGCAIFFAVSPSNTSAAFGVTSYNIPANSGPARSWQVTHGFDHSPTGGLVNFNQAAVGSTGGLAISCNPTTGPDSTNAYSSFPYKSICAASGGISPYTWSIVSGSLPQGLTLTPSGATANIQGVSVNPGAYNYTVRVTDGSSPVQTAVIQFAGTQPVAPMVASFPPALPTNTNIGFVSLGNAEGGTPTYTWSISAGTLPPGVSLVPNGNKVMLQGSLSMPSQYNFTLRLQDSGQPPQVATQNYQGNITIPPISIQTNTLPVARVNQAYLANVQYSGGSAPYTWSLVSGVLPPKLQLNTGPEPFNVFTLISGAPSTQGAYTFTVRITDSASPPNSATQTFTLNVNQGLEVSCSPTIGDNVVGGSFSFTCSAISNELPPFYWVQLDGSLPAGISFPIGVSSSTFTVSGVPTAPGAFQITIAVGKNLVDVPPLLTQVVISGTIVLPMLSATPSLVDIRSSGAPPNQIVAISGIPSGGIFTAHVSSGAQWLSTNVLTGTLPGTISISVNQQNLVAGSVQHGQIAVQADNGSEAVVNVTFEFDRASPGSLTVSPAYLTLISAAAGPGSVGRLQITNSGNGGISYTLSAGAPWVSLSAQTGTAISTTPDLIEITPLLAGLSPGTHRSQITLASADHTQSVLIPLTLVISNAARFIKLTPDALDLTASLSPATGLITIENNGQGSLQWKATSQTGTGSPWLSLAPSSGVSIGPLALPSQLSIVADPGQLPVGASYGMIQALAEAANSPRLATVRLNVLDPSANEPPMVSANGVMITSAAPAAITLKNLQSAPANFTVQAITDDGPAWMVVTPATATVPGLSTTNLNIASKFSGLAPGVRTGKVVITFANGTREIEVTAINAAQNCQPSILVPVLTSLPAAFTTSLGRPTPLNVQVADDCGNPVAVDGVLVDFDDGDAPANLEPSAVGWTYPWIPNNASALNLSLFAFATQNGQRVVGSARVTGIVAADATTPPLIGGIVNSADYLLPGQVAPGGWISIFGTFLIPGESSDPIYPYPTIRDGTMVWFGNTQLPLLYAAPGIINALVPYSAAVNTTQSILIQRGAVFSAPTAIAIVDALPAIYAANGQGFGQGAIVIATSGAIAANDPTLPGSRPATHGEYISIYCSGLGPVDNAPADNQPAPVVAPFSTLKTPPHITIGGIDAPPSYAGLAPGSIGLYQVNVQIPDAAPSGDQVPVQIIVGETASNLVTVAIR
jgi:uncharacterized protein (TIGR03437 family)